MGDITHLTNSPFRAARLLEFTGSAHRCRNGFIPTAESSPPCRGGATIWDEHCSMYRASSRRKPHWHTGAELSASTGSLLSDSQAYCSGDCADCIVGTQQCAA